MSELQQKVQNIRERAVDLMDAIKEANKQGINVEINISTKQKTIDFSMKSSDIPEMDITIKANINQDL